MGFQPVPDGFGDPSYGIVLADILVVSAQPRQLAATPMRVLSDFAESPNVTRARCNWRIPVSPADLKPRRTVVAWPSEPCTFADSSACRLQIRPLTPTSRSTSHESHPPLRFAVAVHDRLACGPGRRAACRQAAGINALVGRQGAGLLPRGDPPAGRPNRGGLAGRCRPPGDQGTLGHGLLRR